MQVAALEQFLRSLGSALEAAGSAHGADIAQTCKALEPFRALGVPEFAAFLSKAREYQMSGTIRAPGPEELKGEEFLKTVAKLSAAQSEADLAERQQEVVAALESLIADVGLKGKLTRNPRWAAAKASRARIAPHLKEIYELAARIISPDVYNDPPIRERIALLESSLDRDALKAVGAEFGVGVTAKSTADKVVGAILVKLTGHKPAKPRAAKAAAAANPAQVEEHGRRLADLVKRAADPDAVPEAEVDSELERLKVLDKPTLIEVAARAGVDGVKPRDAASAILQRIRNRLTAARRARERAEV